MNILVILWTACLARLCHCGDDDGAKGGLRGAFTETPEGLTPVEPTTAVTLDIASPDESKLDIHTRNSDYFEYKLYLPKDAFHISSVVEGDKELWKAAEDEKCEFVGSFEKEDYFLITVFLSGGNNDKYFEKVGSTTWKELKKEELDKKIEEMMKKCISSPTHTEVLQDVCAPITLDIATIQ